MEKIGLHNYEAYFLDYMEGTLSLEEQHDLMQFLEAHPDLKAELDPDLSDFTLEPGSEKFSLKDELKVEESAFVLNADTVEEQMIASIEGELSAEENERLHTYIEQEGLQTSFAYFKATHLIPEMELHADKLALQFGAAFEITSENIDEWMAASVEGQLDSKQAAVFAAYVAENELETELAYYESSVLEADLDIVYLDKAGLKQNGGLVIPMYVRLVASVAAAVLLIFSIYNLNDNAVDLSGGLGDMAEEMKHNGSNAVQEEVNLAAFSGLTRPVFKEQEREEYTVPDRFENRQLIEENIQPNNIVSVDTLPWEKEDAPVINKEDEIIDDEIVDVVVDTIVPDIPTKHLEDQEIIEDIAVVSEPASNVKTEQPYKIFTRLASNAFKRDVSFKRKKDLDTEEYVAYHFKLGRFEFERKKAR